MVELSDPDYVMDLYAESVKMSTYLLAFIVSEFGSTHAKGIVVTQVKSHCKFVQKSQWQRSLMKKSIRAKEPNYETVIDKRANYYNLIMEIKESANDSVSH